MAYCPNCGAPVEGAFCAKCGAALSPAASPQTEAALPLQANVAAALCYIPILVVAVVFLVWAPYNRDKTVRFHAFQALFLQIAWIALWLVFGIGLTLVSFGVLYGLERLLSLAFLVLVGYLMYQTWQNHKIVLPVIGPIAEKQA